MGDSKPYEFGEVVNGHRWTVLGWERAAAAEPPSSDEPVATAAPSTPPLTTARDGAGTARQRVRAPRAAAPWDDEVDDPWASVTWQPSAHHVTEPRVTRDLAIWGSPPSTISPAAPDRPVTSGETGPTDHDARSQRWLASVDASAVAFVEEFDDAVLDLRDPGAELIAAAYVPEARRAATPTPAAGWYPGNTTGSRG